MSINEEENKRVDGRTHHDLRHVELIAGIAPAAAGSVLIKMGQTHVICAVSIEEGMPRWMRQAQSPSGWITAEYRMLPYSTRQRTQRESVRGLRGRTQEIQRLIGRALRAVIDLKQLGERTFWVDCDVLQADGGTRTASITGSFVALRIAINTLLRNGLLKQDPVREAVAAVSVGLVANQTLLDLCYEEDNAAEVDMNLVMTTSGKLVEIQGTGEERPFSRDALEQMLKLGDLGIKTLLAMQEKTLHVKK